ncbi:hypothetical protein N782_17125 [Pontibacillus yanchengensis Y32]|uniref:Uncharacterized protein n=1 Tax=Pontibacillus yanchengensis Y32 TaxID=1385514 RepID=A0A0A2TXY8_9BACI|nr:hypothetical protein N782_17125 [Pontibacillus yanchengensis Y32]
MALIRWEFARLLRKYDRGKTPQRGEAERGGFTDCPRKASEFPTNQLFSTKSLTFLNFKSEINDIWRPTIIFTKKVA